jgi:hypothetical protein
MSQIQFERIWIEQCAAARRVKSHFGLANALDYLIGEKLFNRRETIELCASCRAISRVRGRTARFPA